MISIIPVPGDPNSFVFDCELSIAARVKVSLDKTTPQKELLESIEKALLSALSVSAHNKLKIEMSKSLNGGSL